jgi:hypothetical protein
MNEPNETKTQSTGDFDCELSLTRLLPPGLHVTLRGEFSELWQQRRHMLHLTMAEAAALASQTGLPQLFFPTLALEKAAALAAWDRRQAAIQ